MLNTSIIYGPPANVITSSDFDVNFTSVWYGGVNAITPILKQNNNGTITVTSSGGGANDYSYLLCRRKHNVAGIGPPYTRNTVLKFSIDSSDGGLGIGIYSAQGTTANWIWGWLFMSYNVFGGAWINTSTNANYYGTSASSLATSYGNKIAVKVMENNPSFDGTVTGLYSIDGGTNFTKPSGAQFSSKYTSGDYSNNYAYGIALLIKPGLSGVNATINSLTINDTCPWATF